MHISHTYTEHTYIMGYCVYIYIYLHVGYMYKFTYIYMRSIHWTPFSALMSYIHYISIPAYHRWRFQITLQKACMEHDRISVVWLKILVSLTIGCPCSWGLADTNCSQGSLSTKISASPLGSRVWAGVTARHAPGAAASSAAADRISRRKSWVLCESRRILGLAFSICIFSILFGWAPSCHPKKRYGMNGTKRYISRDQKLENFESDSPTMTKEGEREGVTRKCCPIIFLRYCPWFSLVGQFTTSERCLENPEYTFQPTKNLLQFSPFPCHMTPEKWGSISGKRRHHHIHRSHADQDKPRHLGMSPSQRWWPWSSRPLRPPRPPDVLSDGAPPISNILAEIEEAAKSLQTDSKVQIDVDSWKVAENCHKGVPFVVATSQFFWAAHN